MDKKYEPLLVMERMEHGVCLSVFFFSLSVCRTGRLGLGKFGKGPT
jgi:hypothetical protein